MWDKPNEQSQACLDSAMARKGAGPIRLDLMVCVCLEPTYSVTTVTQQ